MTFQKVYIKFLNLLNLYIEHKSKSVIYVFLLTFFISIYESGLFIKTFLCKNYSKETCCINIL